MIASNTENPSTCLRHNAREAAFSQPIPPRIPPRIRALTQNHENTRVVTVACTCADSVDGSDGTRMIYRLDGVLVEKDPTFCLVDVRGVAYGASIPGSTYRRLPDVGQSTCLWTYLYVREDQLTLFGFSTRDERAAFEVMLGVSGVGPRVALAVLSTLTIAEWARAVVTRDVASLARTPGIGKRTAEHMALDLKDKVDDFVNQDATDLGSRGLDLSASSSAQEQTIEAIVALGATRAEAASRVAQAVRDTDDSADLETLIAAAMRAGRTR
jgi:Holliday junction DNA helicase RuvA